MHRALVTAIGSFSAKAVIGGLKDLGFWVAGCDIYPREWIVDSRSVDAFCQAPRVSDVDGYRSFIRRLCQEERIDLILPLTDVEVDFFNRERSSSWMKDITVCISPSDAIGYCRDKSRMSGFLEGSSSGVVGIPTRLLDDVDEVPVEYPLVCKPLDGRSSQGLRRITSQEEWESLKGIEGHERYVVQPLIEGPIITVDVVRSPVGPTSVAIPREELLRTPNGAGTSVYVFHDDGLVEGCTRLADELGIIGCVNCEFIKAENGRYYFLECNPRFAGGVRFSCMAAYDCVANHVRAFLGEAIEDLDPYENQYIARRYEEHVMRVEDSAL